MNQWQQKIEETVEQMVQNSPFKDVGQNAKTFLVSALRQLDVVTREEFDVQAAMLVRTRERLETLEKQVAELERAGK
jgi:BMFP domain-containing protein YqiC